MILVKKGDAACLPYPANYFDGLVTDPPYGYGFMGKDWDKVVVPTATWKVILVVMKPLTERTYLDQAMKDGKGVTWLEAGRIPIEGADKKVLEAKNPHTVKADNAVYGDYSMCKESWEVPQGRFPANLLVSDDVLDDGVPHPATVDRNLFEGETEKLFGPKGHQRTSRGDTGTFSRYFSLGIIYLTP
jgi:hypothetical protein